jgi:hypothetical protein
VKYPHLVVGSIASSGVVEAILDFPAFDAQVERSAGEVCADALRQVTGLVESGLPGVKSRFGCSADVNINDDDFMFMIADAQVEGIQYGMREKLCNAVVPSHLRMLSSSSSSVHRHLDHLSSASSPSFDLLSAFVNYTNAVFFGEQGNSCDDYARKSWMDLSHGNADRSWGWQTCTEVGYWYEQNKPKHTANTQTTQS